MADNKFFNMFNDIDDKYIKEAEQTASGPDMYIEYVPWRMSKRTVIISATAALAACAALVFGITKLPGLIHGIETSRSEVNNSSAEAVYGVPTLVGTPIPDGELEEFDLDALADSYRETFPEELTALLGEISDPAAADAYVKARTLADLTSGISNADVIATDKAREKMEKQMRACVTVTEPTIDTAYPDPVFDLYETGYRYGGFVQLFREFFCDEAAENLIICSRRSFIDNGGQLYAADGYETGGVRVLGLVHTDYELITNTDSQIVFNTVRYYDYAVDGEREPYDSANKDSYINKEGQRFVSIYTNRLVKEDGLWRAENIDYGYAEHTLPYAFDRTYPQITDKSVLEYTPLPEGSHIDFDYGEALSKYTETLKKDENLTAVLEQIGDAEFTERYYNARTLAEILAANENVHLFTGKDSGFALNFLDEYNQNADRYLETCFTYDSFANTLKDAFGSETFYYMLEHGTFYDYDGVLCKGCRAFSENPLLVHSEYELTSRTEDEIVFDTLCYHIRPEEYNAFVGFGRKQPYDPSKRSDYIVTRITNRFVKEDGKWRAEELCFLGDMSSVGRINDGADNIELDTTKLTFHLEGTPLPESELADFSYEETLENYRKKLDEDEGLTALLERINKPDFTDIYYRARTLADMLALVGGTELAPSEKIRSGHEAATITSLTPISSMVFIYDETGYTYDSFTAAYREIFGGDIDKAIRLYNFTNAFRELDGALYYRERYYPYEDIFLVHTDYELITNTDGEVVFDSICYMVDWDYYDLNAPELIKPKFDPNNTDGYVINRITNRFVKENGKWRAERLCMDDGKSSAWETSGGDVQTDEHGNSVIITGTPRPESALADFTYEKALENYRKKLDEDEGLTALLEQINNPGFTESFYRAKTLADIAAMHPDVEREVCSGQRAQIKIYEDSPDIYNSAIVPRYSYGQTFRESGCKYKGFIDALYKAFTEDSVALLLMNAPHVYEHDGQLYYESGTAQLPENLVHTEYELVENTADTIRFTTVNYYVTSWQPGSKPVYDPAIKELYDTTRIGNEFRYIDGEWKAYEICMLDGKSSSST